jgi:hypothetical protein
MIEDVNVHKTAFWSGPSPRLLRRILTGYSDRNPTRPGTRRHFLAAKPHPDIVDAHRLLANLGIQGQRLSASFRKAWIRSATSKATAPSASVATSETPLPSSNSTNTKEFRGNPPIMASFFQNTMSSASRNAPCALTSRATSNMCVPNAPGHQQPATNNQQLTTNNRNRPDTIGSRNRCTN